MNYPGVADLWKSASQSAQNDLLLTIHLQKNDLNLSFFSTIATLGTPYDITLQEIRIECFFPADDLTESNWSRP
jgi:MmyB-like transcription regulator ligand binding domain